MEGIAHPKPWRRTSTVPSWSSCRHKDNYRPDPEFMSVALQLVVSGVAIGSIYALLALSLVIINKATDVVNFAQGEIAMLGTFAALAALSAFKLPLWLLMLAAFPAGILF